MGTVCVSGSQEGSRRGLTLACRAICLTRRGRFRSETIFVTVVSTKPSRSEKEEREKDEKKIITEREEMKMAALPLRHWRVTRLHS